MGKFEAYQENQRKHLSEMYPRTVEKEKGVKETPFVIGYDANQLLEHYDERMENSTFAERTAYYFQDAGMMTAKSVRYRALGEGNRTGEIDSLAERYTNRSAYKRKKRAREASRYFGKAAVAMEKLRKSKRLPLNVLYEKREEIMRLRMDGMLKAAKVKAQSEEHEQYLQNKAKLSCLTILMDQLQQIRKEAKIKEDADAVRKLDGKLTSLTKELNQVKDEVRRTLPPIEEKWEREHDITDQAAEQRARQEEKNNPYIRPEDAKALITLEELKKQQEGHYPAFPMQVVRLDRNGQPMNKAEALKLQWNRRYQGIKSEEAQEGLSDRKKQQLRAAEEKMLHEAISRIEKFELPPLESLLSDGLIQQGEPASVLFQKNAAKYYEMLVMAPQFLNTEMNKEGDTVVKRYATEHPAFAAKVEALNRLSAFFRLSLATAGIHMDEARFLEAEERSDVDILQFGKIQKALEASYQELETKTTEAKDAKLAKEEQEKIELPTQAEKEQEFQALHEKNPEFTKKDYKVLLEGRAANQTWELKKYTDIVKEILEKQVYGTTVVTLNRDLGPVLRAVHYDKNGKPISDLDRERAKQNDEWVNAWKEDTEENRAIRERLIEKEIPTIFDGFEFPDPEHLLPWLQKQIQENYFRFTEMMQRALGLDNLKKIHPSVNEYIRTHPLFEKKWSLIPPLSAAWETYIRGNHLYNQRASMVNPEIDDTQTRSQQKEFFAQNYNDMILPVYQAQYESYLEFTNREKNEILNVNPDMKEKDVNLLLRLRRSGVVSIHPVYQKLLDDENRKREGVPGKPQLDLSRNLAPMLKSVHFDADNEPVTELDKLRHEQNLRWINAWIRDTEEDREYREELLKQEVPHLFDGFELPEPDRVLSWMGRVVEKDLDAFLEMSRRNLGLDCGEDSPYLQEQMNRQRNPEFVAKADCFTKLNSLLPPYFAINHHINRAGQGSAAEPMDDGTYETLLPQFRETLDFVLAEYREKYGIYQQARQNRQAAGQAAGNVGAAAN